MKISKMNPELLSSIKMIPRYEDNPARLSPGTKVSRITIDKYEGISLINRKHYYRCHCDCGCEEDLIIEEGTIKNTGKPGRNQILSCGCGSLERTLKASAARKKNKYSNKYKAVSIYYAIRERCYCTTYRKYYKYGGRGIKMCPEWEDLEHGLDNFCDWMYNVAGYSDDLEYASVDRINNNESYSPSNCRLLTYIGQSNNKDQNLNYIWYNQPYNAAELANIFMCGDYCIRTMINSNRSVHELLQSQYYQDKIRKGTLLDPTTEGMHVTPKAFAIVPFRFVDHVEVGERSRWRQNQMYSNKEIQQIGLNTLAEKIRLEEKEAGKAIKPFQFINSGSTDFLLNTYIDTQNYRYV